MNDKAMKSRRGRILLKSVIILGSLLLVLAGLRLVLFHGPVRTPEPLPEAPILDMHCHTAGIGAGGSGCFVTERLQSSWKFDAYLDAFGLAKEDLEREGDGVVIDRIAQLVRESETVSGAVVLAMDGVVDADGVVDMEHTELLVPDAFVQEQTARHKELYFGASIHPSRKDALERLEWAAAHGAVLVKWIPSIMWIDPADPAVVPFYRKMKELGLPLLCHVGNERSFSTAKDELCDPVRLKPALDLGLTVIAAHMATTGENDGEENVDRLLAMMVKYPNLYTDISSLTQLNKLGSLDRALEEECLEGRLLYGTDFPLIETALVTPWYFPLHLTLGRMSELSGIENPFDRDVRLKQALGVPAETFARGARLILD